MVLSLVGGMRLLLCFPPYLSATQDKTGSPYSSIFLAITEKSCGRKRRRRPGVYRGGCRHGDARGWRERRRDAVLAQQLSQQQEPQAVGLRGLGGFLLHLFVFKEQFP